MLVRISDKEQSRIETGTYYYRKHGLDVEVCNLEVGDYIFSTADGGSVVFEFKTIADFVNSINDGRLWNEAINQAENYDYHFVMIHGDLSERIKCVQNNRYVQMSVKQYIGAICSLNRYTTVLQCFHPNINEAYYTMWKQAEKCLSDKPVVKKFPKKEKNPAFNFLCYAVYGVSWKKARAIVNSYDLRTLADLQNLTVEKLVGVEGIGEKRAKKIMDAIR